MSPLCDLVPGAGVARGVFPMPRLDRLVVRGAPGLPNRQGFFFSGWVVVLYTIDLPSAQNSDGAPVVPCSMQRVVC